MRIALRLLAGILGVLGLGAAAAGATAAAVVGSDDTLTVVTGPMEVNGVAWSTAPGLFTRYGPTLHLTARSQRPGEAPLFIGVAPSFQVADYLRETERSELTEAALFGALSTQEIEGSTTIEDPGELDFWSTKSKGTSVSLDWPIPNGQNDVVIMRANGSAVGVIDFEAGVEIDGVFSTAVGLAVGGLSGVGAAVMIFVATHRRRELGTAEVAP